MELAEKSYAQSADAERFGMSRIAKEPVSVPNGVNVMLDGMSIGVKGPKGELNMNLHPAVAVSCADDQIKVDARNASAKSRAMSGTFRSLIANMVTGVTSGFEKGILIVGTGYRAKADGNRLNLSLGFSHPIEFVAPDAITFEIKSEGGGQVELVIRGIEKQMVGQVAADLRRLRPPEPYKGKGVRYADERIRRKQAKNVG